MQRRGGQEVRETILTLRQLQACAIRNHRMQFLWCCVMLVGG